MLGIRCVNSLTMYPSRIVLWYIPLFVASFSYSLENSTNNDDEQKNNLMMHDLLINSTKNQDDEMQLILHNLHENSTKNDNEMQYEFHINSNDNKNLTRSRIFDKYSGHITKIYKENQMEPRMNSTEINDVNNSMLQTFDKNLTKTDRETNSISYEYKNFNTDDYNSTITIISYEACDNETCIQLCCPFGDRLTSEKKCVAGQNNYSFPDVYQNDSENRKLNELFQLTVHDPCVVQGSAHRVLNSNEYLFLVNGSLYLDPDEFISSTSYCLGVLDRDTYDTIVCMHQIGFPTYMSICLLVSLPFLLLTFVVYSILPEVQNIHSYTLRVHVASLFITNLIIFCVVKIRELSEWKYCIPLGIAYVNYNNVAM